MFHSAFKITTAAINFAKPNDVEIEEVNGDNREKKTGQHNETSLQSTQTRH